MRACGKIDESRARWDSPLPGSRQDPRSGTREPLPYNREGLLLVKGPNCMAVYLGQPEKTQEVNGGGWYVTGDIACIDEDGFIRITDRLTRFSKIGGEMVPHMRIEEAARTFLGSMPAPSRRSPTNTEASGSYFPYQPGPPRGEVWERLSHLICRNSGYRNGKTSTRWTPCPPWAPANSISAA